MSDSSTKPCQRMPAGSSLCPSELCGQGTSRLIHHKTPAQVAALDGIRGLAALMVMLLHGWQAGVFDNLSAVSRLSRIALFGQTGVDLFFVLSGFLITRILISTRDDPGFFRNFYARRALRIFPLYFLFLSLYYCVLPLLQRAPIAPLKYSWWYWVYLQNVPPTFRTLYALGPEHFWSLAVEEHFYLLWPLLVLLVPVRRLAWFSAVLAIGAALCRWVFLYQLHLRVFYLTPCRMDALALGTLLACLEVSGKLLRLRTLFAGILIFCLPVLAVIFMKHSGEGKDWVQLSKFTLVAVMYFSVLGLVICYQQSKWVERAFANGPIRLTGKISYGLYVYHPLCYAVVARWVPVATHGLLALAAGVAATFVVSWLSFTFFESPFLRLKQFFT